MDIKTRYSLPQGSRVWLWGLGLVLVQMMLVVIVVSQAGQTARLTQNIGAVNGQVVTLEQFNDEVRLQETRNAMRGDSATEIDEAHLLNEMVGDMLMLQAAAESGVEIDDERVQAEIDGILIRVDFSAEEMELLLAEHVLAWGDFASSVRNYLIIAEYLDEVLLAEVPVSEQQARVQNWLVDRYADSDIIFDEDFLNQINAPDILSPEEL